MARTGKLVAQGNVNVTWSDGTLFDGFCLLVLLTPYDTDLQASWPWCYIAGKLVQQRLPQFTICPIKAGQFNQSVTTIWNADIQPPQSQYTAFYFDWTGKVLGGTNFFTASTDPVPVPLPKLIVPTGPRYFVLPEGVDMSLITLSIFPTRYNDSQISGSRDGVNAVFTLPVSSYTVLNLYLNGDLLEEGVAYSKSGATITFFAGYIPQSGDRLNAMVW